MSSRWHHTNSPKQVPREHMAEPPKTWKNSSLIFFISRKETSEGARLNRVNMAPPQNHACDASAFKQGDAGVPNQSDSWKDSSFVQDLLFHLQKQLPTAGIKQHIHVNLNVKILICHRCVNKVYEQGHRRIENLVAFRNQKSTWILSSVSDRYDVTVPVTTVEAEESHWCRRCEAAPSSIPSGCHNRTTKVHCSLTSPSSSVSVWSSEEETTLQERWECNLSNPANTSSGLRLSKQRTR